MNSARTINFPILTAFLLITSLCSYSQEDSSENEKSKLILKTANGKVLVVSNKIPTDPAENAKLAKEILEKGKENLKRMNYKSTYVDDTKGKKRTRIICNKSNPDGTNNYRYENGVEGSFYTSIMIRRSDAVFHIYGNTAVKVNYDDGYEGPSMGNKLPTRFPKILTEEFPATL